MVNEKKFVWNYFKDVTISNSKTRKIECIFCYKQYTANATRMVQHILVCVKCPVTVKQIFEESQPSTSTSFKESVSAYYDMDINADELDEKQISQEPDLNPAPQGQGEIASDPSASSSKSLSKSSQWVSVGHWHSDYKSGSSSEQQQRAQQQREQQRAQQQPKFNTMMHFCDSISQRDQMIANELISRAIYASGLPLRLLESPHWQAVFKHVRPALKLPSQDRLSNVLLEEEWNRVKAFVEAKVAEARFITLQCDGWSNVRNENIVNFIVTTPDPVFYKSLPTRTETHTAEYMANLISTVIDDVGPEKVLSCVTDNASNMKKTWEILEEKYIHVSFYSCIYHSLHLLIEDIIKLKTIISLKNEVARIVTHIKCSQILTAHFTQIKKEKSVNVPLKLPVSTRWTSIVRCFNSLISNKFCLQALAVNEAVVKCLKEDIKIMMLDDVFWVRLENTRDLLEPIGKWITQIEGEKPNVSFVPEIFANLKQIFEEKVPKCAASKAKEKIIMDILANRQNFCSHKFHLAANILDPRYQGHNLSTEEHVDGLEFINKISEHMNDVDAGEVITDLAKYKAKHELWAKEFVWKCAEKVDPVVWWKGMCSTSPLSKVASAILSMATTTTERSFSTYSRIHTKSRNRLTTEREEKIFYIGYNLKLLTDHKTQKTTTNDAGEHGSEVLLHSSTASTDQVQEQDPFELDLGLSASASTVTKRCTRWDSGISAKQTKKTLVEDNKELEHRLTNEYKSDSDEQTAGTNDDSIALHEDSSFSSDDGD